MRPSSAPWGTLLERDARGTMGKITWTEERTSQAMDVSQRMKAERNSIHMMAVPAGLYLVILLFFCLLPAWRTRAARDWPAVPCRIVSLATANRTSPQGEATFRIQVSYSYPVDGQEHTSNRFSFHNASENHREHLDAMVDMWRKRPNPTCRVNPAQAAEAVLDPDYVPESSTSDFILLMSPMAFVAIWLLAVVRYIRSNLKPQRGKAA